MSNDGFERIAQALHGAIGNETRNQLVRVTGVILPNGNIPCYSEALGNVNAICRTTDDIKPGAWIYIYKTAPEKHAPWMYAGFASGHDRKARPGISDDVVIQVPVPNDSGPGNGGPGGSPPPPPAGSLQKVIDDFAKQIRLIKGTSAWDGTVDTNLSHLITWRGPVSTVGDLPAMGNRIGDMRYVVLSNALFVWTNAGWRSPNAGDATGSSSSQGIALMRTGAAGIGAFVLAAHTENGIVPADATNLAHAGEIAGITLESAGANQQVMVQVSGPLHLPTAVFNVSKGTVFVGIGGTLTTAIPIWSKFVQHVGLVISSNEILLQVATGTTIVLDEPYNGLGNGYAPPATTTTAGLVEFAAHNESAPLKAVQADDPRLIGGTSGAYYRHSQPIAASVWTITHNLGWRPSVNVVDTAGTELVGAVDYVDLNTLTISFNAAFSGTADLT